MTKVRQREMPQDPDAKAIVKTLADATVWGHRQDDIFEDWLAVVETTLDALPAQAKAVAITGQMTDDTPEVKATWERINQRYGSKANELFSIFAKAFRQLLDACTPDNGYRDLLGDIYMAWGWPNSHLGQYFTPMPIATMMAQMQVPDGEAGAFRVLEEAYRKSKWGRMHVLLAEGADERIPAFVRETGPDKIIQLCAEHIKPIKVLEPCIGSGVLVLAMAAQFPRWAHQFGIVQFYGNDIDAACVRMARINFMLYGLNAYGLRCWLSLTEGEIDKHPLTQTQRAAIAEAKEAHEHGDSDRVAEIANDVRFGKYEQVALLEMAEA